MATELDDNFRNCYSGWAHVNCETVQPFYMERSWDKEMNTGGWEYFPTDISKIDADLTLSGKRVIPPYGWFGGFENCIIKNTIFETVQYSSESWLGRGVNDSFYNVDWNSQPKLIELFLPHLCHSRISNSKICYMMGDESRYRAKMAASIKNGAAVPPGYRAVHDQVRVGNASQYVNCHIKIRPQVRNAPKQPNCKAVFYSCYFENCTFEIHKRSNVEFTNCVFV